MKRLTQIITAIICSWASVLIVGASWAQEVEVTAGEPIAEEYTEAFSVTNQVFQAQVTQIVEEVIEPYDQSQDILFQTVLVQNLDEPGQPIQVEFNRTLSQGQSKLAVGDKVLVNQSTDNTGFSTYYIIDYVRTDALLSLFILFIIVVLLVGQMRGVTSFLGLISSYLIIFALILPGIQTGYDPLLVAIAGSALIIGITFYLSHGFSEKTHWAVLGTLVSLIVTGILALIFVDQARLTGFGAEEVAFLQMLKSGELNVRGLLLAGILIGALGVLDDVTISQASIVQELKRTNKQLTSNQLFIKAMNIGRDHIASLVNTLILVYTGGALPLLLMFTVDSSRSILDVINYEVVAEEIVTMLVGSIGLVIAVPITTALAAWFGFKHIKPSKNKKIIAHAH